MIQEGLLLVDNKSKDAFITAWIDAFKREFSKDFFSWIFNEKNIIYAYIIDNEIAAGYCLLPFKAMIENKETTALLCNNVFVSPKHQGKQLFVKLSKLALDDVYKRLGYEFAYGIPNPQALPGHKRVGWKIKDEIDFLVKKREFGNSSTKEVWFGEDLSDNQIKDIENCSRESSLDKSFSIIKTKDFIEWRYLSKPGTQYSFCLIYEHSKLKAYSVFKVFREDGVLDIVDFDAADSDSAIKLINTINQSPLNFKHIQIWGSNKYRDCFIESGFNVADKKSSLIFINPSDKKDSYWQNRAMNLVLADNDVY